MNDNQPVAVNDPELNKLLPAGDHLEDGTKIVVRGLGFKWYNGQWCHDGRQARQDMINLSVCPSEETTRSLIRRLSETAQEGDVGIVSGYFFIWTNEKWNHVNDPGVYHAMETLREVMNSDVNYAFGWQSNLAMAMYDTCQNKGFTDISAALCNEAALRFMHAAFDYTPSSDSNTETNE